MQKQILEVLGDQGAQKGLACRQKKIGKQIHNFLRIGIYHQFHQMSLFFCGLFFHMRLLAGEAVK